MWKSWRTAKKLRVQIISKSELSTCVYSYEHTHTVSTNTSAWKLRQPHTCAHTRNRSLHPRTSPQITFHSNTRNKVPLAEEGRRGRSERGGERRERDRKSEMETIDRLELAQSGIELYQKGRASQQEAFWFVSKGENRGMFALYSSFASLIHFHFSFHPQPCLFKEFFLAFFAPPPPSWLLHLSLSPFVFTPLFLPASFSPFFSRCCLISILSVRIIDSSCLPLVEMSFIILCDSWLAGWMAGWLTEWLACWLTVRQSGHWPICSRYKETDNQIWL